MSNLVIKDVSPELMWRLKASAAEEQKTLKQYVVDELSHSLEVKRIHELCDAKDSTLRRV